MLTDILMFYTITLTYVEHSVTQLPRQQLEKTISEEF